MGAATLAALALVQGAGHILDSRAPRLALTLAPWFASAYGREAELALVAGDGDLARSSAIAALRRDATLVPAVRTLGQLDEGLRGAKLLDLSLHLSRRDLPTHMALLQRAAAVGDLDAVMSHYGQALRTNQRSWSTLLPPLARAAADPALLGPLSRALASRPQWLFSFYREWMKSSPDPRAMVTLSRELERLGQPLNRDVRMGLLSRLVEARDWTSLRDELTRARPACGADLCLDGQFRRYGLLQPVDWSPGATDRTLVVRTPLGDGAWALDYSFAGPGDAIVARRLMLLPPGEHVFGYALGPAGMVQAAGDVGLALECADDGGATLSDPARGTATIRRTVARVPATCPAQWLTLRVASDTNQPASGRILRVWRDAVPSRTR